jgi:ABC-2 type transport system permease protein
MLRLMKADFYRLFHSKGFYLIFLVTIGLAGIIIISESFSTIAVVSTRSLETALETSNHLKWNAVVALKSALLLSSLLIYLSVGLFLIITGQEFSQKTYRNTLAAGVDRITFVISKYFTQLLSILLVIILYLSSILTFAFFKYGMTEGDVKVLIRESVFATLSLMFAISVILSLANILLISFSSSVLAASFILFYPLVIQVIGLESKWSVIKYFDLLGMVQRMTFEELSGTALIPYILMNAILLICSIIISAWVMKKKEL